MRALVALVPIIVLLIVSIYYTNPNILDVIATPIAATATPTATNSLIPKYLRCDVIRNTLTFIDIRCYYDIEGNIQ